MRLRGLVLRSIWQLGVLGIILAAPALVLAQTSSSSDSSSDTSTSGMAGVVIDAEGVLRTKVFSDPTGQVMRERVAAAKTTLDPKVTAFSKMRKVSLNRLEKAILDHQSTLNDEMRYLAGLQRGPLRVLLSRQQGHRPGRSGRRMDRRSFGTHRRFDESPARHSVARLGCRASGVSLGWRSRAVDRLLDRSDPRGAGRDADVRPRHSFERPAERRRRSRHRRGRAHEPWASDCNDSRRFAEEPFRPGVGRGRLPDEVDRHWIGAAAGQDDQLRGEGQAERNQPERDAAMVLLARLPVRSPERRQSGDGVGRRRREAGRARTRSLRRAASERRRPAGPTRPVWRLSTASRRSIPSWPSVRRFMRSCAI